MRKATRWLKLAWGQLFRASGQMAASGQRIRLLWVVSGQAWRVVPSEVARVSYVRCGSPQPNYLFLDSSGNSRRAESGRRRPEQIPPLGTRCSPRGTGAPGRRANAKLSCRCHVNTPSPGSQAGGALSRRAPPIPKRPLHLPLFEPPHAMRPKSLKRYAWLSVGAALCTIVLNDLSPVSRTRP